MRQQFTALVALVGAMVLVGSSVAVGRLLVIALPVYFASLVRFALATAVLVPLVLLFEGRWPKVSRQGLAILGGQALCGSFLFTVCLLAGLRLTGAAEAGVVAATTPAAVALMGRLFFREHLSSRALAGLAATSLGLAALEAGLAPMSGPDPLLGNALVLGAVLFEAVFLLLRRALPDPLSPLAAAMWVSLLGLALFLIPGLWEASRLDPAALSPAMLAALAYYGLGVTALAYMLWFYGVVRVDAALAGVITGVMPVSALACAVWLCGEVVGWRELIGCAGVLAGILCLAGQKKPTAGAPLSENTGGRPKIKNRRPWAVAARSRQAGEEPVPPPAARTGPEACSRAGSGHRPAASPLRFRRPGTWPGPWS